jgi:4-amino-4-deoxy-L-arabinose transferase-like glycosyltransferase
MYNITKSFSNDYDEGVYLCSASLVSRGEPLFSSVFCSQPPVFVESLALEFRLAGESVNGGRMLIVGFALLALASMAWLGWNIAGPLSAPIALAGLFLQPCFFENARTCQPDIPSLAFATLALAIALQATKSRHPNTLLLFAGVFFSLGALTKLLVIPMLIPILVVVLWPSDGDSKTLQRIWRGKFVNLAVFASSGMGVALLFAVHYKLAPLYAQTISYHESAKIAFPLNMAGNRQMLSQMLLNALGITLLAIGAQVFLLRHNRFAFIWLSSWLLATFAFVLTHSPLWPRHLMLAAAPVAASCSAIMIGVNSRRKGAVFFMAYIMLMLCLSINAQSLSPRFYLGHMWNRGGDSVPEAEKEVLRLIEQNTRPDDRIVTDQQMQAFRSNRLVPASLCDTSIVRIKSDHLTSMEAIHAAQDVRMVIFWTHRLDSLPDFVEWVKSNYTLLKRFGESEIYIRN